MALGRAYSVALVGLNGHLVEVEADIGRTLPGIRYLGPAGRLVERSQGEDPVRSQKLRHPLEPQEDHREPDSGVTA